MTYLNRRRIRGSRPDTFLVDAASSSSDHTKTAASARSTWPSTSPTTARSTGPSLKRRWSSSTRFLDDVVSANKYVPAVPQLQDAAHRVRRIGLGIMGLADVMYRVGVRYGDQELLDLAGQVMEFVRYHCMRTSIDLARERGPFLAIEGSIYDPNNLKWQPPTPLQPYTHEFGRPAVDWDAIVEGIKAHGIRNGAQTTVAPTGTIGTVTGCEGYGCEPVFALAYTRYVKEAGGDVTLTYVSPLFIEALDQAGITGESRERIVDQIVLTGTCQGVDELPQALQHTFVVSSGHYRRTACADASGFAMLC